jgi:hypothetical protein
MSKFCLSCPPPPSHGSKKIMSVFSCTLAGVELRDGGTENSDLLGTFCQNKPPTQKSSDNTLYIKYFTNSQNPNNGFKANARIGKYNVDLVCRMFQILDCGLNTRSNSSFKLISMYLLLCCDLTTILEKSWMFFVIWCPVFGPRLYNNFFKRYHYL